MPSELHWYLLQVILIEAFEIAQNLVKRCLFSGSFSDLLAFTQFNLIIILGSFYIYLEKATAVELFFPQRVPQIVCDEF